MIYNIIKVGYSDNMRYAKKMKVSEKMLIANRKNAKLGGRPKGILGRHTIKNIQTREAFAKIVAEHAGQIADDLLRGSRLGKVEASKELLNRSFGAVVQKNINENINMSLKDLAEMRQKQRMDEALKVSSETSKENDINIA